MKVYKKQEGYTLLLTLVIVVLLFLITTSFTVASMNQNKQVKSTDNSFVATSLAEMGAEITKQRINQKFDSLKIPYKECLNNSTNTKETCATQLLNAIAIDSQIANITETVTSNQKYVISSGNVDNVHSKITFSSTGISSTNHKQIYLTIDFKDAIAKILNSADLTTNPILNPTSPSIYNDSIRQCLDNITCKEKLDDSGIFYYKTTPQNLQLTNGSDGNLITYLFDFSVNFGQLFKKDSITHINLYTFGDFYLQFDRFVAMTHLGIETNKLIFSHNSDSQTAIQDSTLIANILEINGSNVNLPIADTTLCLRTYSDNVLQLIKPVKDDDGNAINVNIYLLVNSSSAVKTENHKYRLPPKKDLYTAGTRHYVLQEQFDSNCKIKAKEFPNDNTLTPPVVDDITYN